MNHKKGIRTFTIFYSWATQRQSEQNNRYKNSPEGKQPCKPEGHFYCFYNNRIRVQLFR